MIIQLFMTSASALSYGSIVEGTLIHRDKTYTIIEISSNNLQIRIRNKDIEFIREDE